MGLTMTKKTVQSPERKSMEFIYFGNDWFAENRTSSHHIAKRLGAKFPILYVEVPGLKAPQVNSRDMLKVFEKLRMAFRPPQLVAPHFWRMTLPQIPFRRFAAPCAQRTGLSAANATPSAEPFAGSASRTPSLGFTFPTQDFLPNSWEKDSLSSTALTSTRRCLS